MRLPYSFHLVTALAFYFLSSVESTAAGAPPDPDFSEVAIYRGPIKKEQVDAFLREYAKKHVSSLRINSNGGEVLAGIELGRWVHSLGLPVSVQTICMSSCANYVFTAGSKKTIEPGAIVIWHGSTEQKNIREEQLDFERLEKSLIDSPLDSVEHVRLEQRRPRYMLIQKQRNEEAKFFKELGINEYFMRLGQEPFPVADAWTTTLTVMNKFGLQNIRAPTNYGSAQYIHSNPVAIMMFRNKLGSFDLDVEGNVEIISGLWSSKEN